MYPVLSLQETGQSHLMLRLPPVLLMKIKDGATFSFPQVPGPEVKKCFDENFFADDGTRPPVLEVTQGNFKEADVFFPEYWSSDMTACPEGAKGLTSGTSPAAGASSGSGVSRVAVTRGRGAKGHGGKGRGRK